MPPTLLDVRQDDDAGLVLDLDLPGGLAQRGLRVRATVDGHIAYRVWSGHEAGLKNGVRDHRREEVPVWAEPGFRRGCFGPGRRLRIWRGAEDDRPAVRVTDEDDRVCTVLELTVTPEGSLALALSVGCASRQWTVPLPACAVELSIVGWDFGGDPCYTGAMSSPAEVHPAGRVADLSPSGVTFHPFGTIGMLLPLICLHDAADAGGLRCEILCGDRPHLRVLPAESGRVRLDLAWPLGRQIQPGQWHRFAGPLLLTGYRGRAVQALRDWRDAAAERFGLAPPPTPDWVRRATIAEVDLNPEHGGHDFRRLDDPRARDLLARFADMGYTLIYTVGQFNIGPGGWLSPIDYRTREDLGGETAERQFLTWAHGLGLHVLIWVTTVGVDRHAPQVAAHAHRFTRRRDGRHYFAWGELKGEDHLGYAPDADPESRSWRDWLEGEVRAVIGRGYDGIFVDGLLPRSDNHERATWPGIGRNGIDAQSHELARLVRALGRDLIYFPEDSSLNTQVHGHISIGRYTAAMPPVKRDAYLHDTFGSRLAGTPAVAMPPIAPEQVRDFLDLRLASFLPGVVWQDMAPGYVRESCRPWIVWSLFAGAAVKTHTQYIERPEEWQAVDDVDPPPPAERAPAWRRRGHAEFVDLLRFCRDEPLIRSASRSQAALILDGDAAAVGLLRPGAERCLLAVLQFADRPATLRLRLAAPDDVPAVERAAAGAPQRGAWSVRELRRSMVDTEAVPPATWGEGAEFEVAVAAYGFRLFELRRPAPGAA